MGHPALRRKLLAQIFTKRGESQELVTLIRLLLQHAGSTPDDINQSALSGLSPIAKDLLASGSTATPILEVLHDYETTLAIELTPQGRPESNALA